MSPRVIACDQGSAEWFKARAGLPTASGFATILAKGKDGKSPSLTRRTYMLKLAGELLTGEPAESYSNAHMERGKLMEDEARDLYAFMHGAEPERVGFIVNGGKGCSPDSLIGTNGGLEIKTKLPHILLDVLLKGELPPEHKAQIQGSLWITEREWWDFAAYWPRLPLFVTRVYRDDGYIANLAGAVDAFADELAATVEHIRRMGEARTRSGGGMSAPVQAIFDLIALAMLLVFRLAPFVGCAYLVLWCDASPWWFLLAALIAFSVTARIKLGAAP